MGRIWVSCFLLFLINDLILKSTSLAWLVINQGSFFWVSVCLILLKCILNASRWWSWAAFVNQSPEVHCTFYNYGKFTDVHMIKWLCVCENPCIINTQYAIVSIIIIIIKILSLYYNYTILCVLSISLWSTESKLWENIFLFLLLKLVIENFLTCS